MIPKVIHYCWFGGKELTSLAKKCIESWRKFFPDYEIRCWNESNFDVNKIPYTAEAYAQRKYAFVSDYARFWILYNYGGIYFDTDVKVLKQMSHIINKGEFMARENCEYSKNTGVAPGLGLAMKKGSPVLRDLLDIYESMGFINPDIDPQGKTIVDIASEYFENKGLKYEQTVQQVAGITIYPEDYFCPLKAVTGHKEFTNNTVAIHLYSGSWTTKSNRLKGKIKRLVGQKISLFLINLKSYLKGNGKKF